MNPSGTNAGAPALERFEIAEVVGRGGARTFRARERQTGTEVALKLLPQGLTALDLGPLMERGRTLAALHPASLAAYTDHGQTAQGQPFVTRAWLEGEDLGARLARQPPTVAESLALMRAAATALAEIHRHGVVHGNLKPSNLILRDAALEHVVLVDPGLMLGELSERTLGGAGEIMGTLHYMAPEQARGERQLGPATDIYSLGCVLFECLDGKAAVRTAIIRGVRSWRASYARRRPSLGQLRPDVTRGARGACSPACSPNGHSRSAGPG